jgi:uncharacterized protein YutE (UPF0331/DUF86 family)
MIDRESVCRRLHALERYCDQIEQLARTVSRERFDADLGTQWMIEHGLQLAIECVLDIAGHLVAAERMGSPDSYREVIELLGEHGVLPAEFVRKTVRMPGFRNILVHDYLAVDLSIVWQMFQKGPRQFREFIRHVATHVRSLGSE